MPARAKRWSDPSTATDGLRVLATRYRPRGVRKGEEPWDRWDQRLAPSVALLDAYLGKVRVGRKVTQGAAPIAWDEFARRFARELEAAPALAALAEYRAHLARGEALTLLCYCEDAARCHRTLLVKALGQT